MQALRLGAGWMLWLGVAIGAQASAELGWRIITERSLGNCGACHAWQAAPASTSTFAPALDGVAQRYSAAQLRQWVVDARHLRPDTLMPVFGTVSGLRQPVPAQAVLSAEQIDAVVLALQQRTAISSMPAASASPLVTEPMVHVNATPGARQSGLAFLSPSLRQMNDDDMANPMSLWIERGLAAWGQTSSGPSCQSCHGPVQEMR